MSVPLQVRGRGQKIVIRTHRRIFCIFVAESLERLYVTIMSTVRRKKNSGCQHTVACWCCAHLRDDITVHNGLRTDVSGSRLPQILALFLMTENSPTTVHVYDVKNAVGIRVSRKRKNYSIIIIMVRKKNNRMK